jgi:hypothetical protein
VLIVESHDDTADEGITDGEVRAYQLVEVGDVRLLVVGEAPVHQLQRSRVRADDESAVFGVANDFDVVPADTFEATFDAT